MKSLVSLLVLGTSSEKLVHAYTCNDGCVIEPDFTNDDMCDCSECEDESKWNCDTCFHGCPSVCGLYTNCPAGNEHFGLSHECSGEEECTNDNFYCIDSNNGNDVCTITCSGMGSCNGGVVVIANTGGLQLHCDGYDGCFHMHVQWVNSDNLATYQSIDAHAVVGGPLHSVDCGSAIDKWSTCSEMVILGDTQQLGLDTVTQLNCAGDKACLVATAFIRGSIAVDCIGVDSCDGFELTCMSGANCETFAIDANAADGATMTCDSGVQSCVCSEFFDCFGFITEPTTSTAEASTTTADPSTSTTLAETSTSEALATSTTPDASSTTVSETTTTEALATSATPTDPSSTVPDISSTATDSSTSTASVTGSTEPTKTKIETTNDLVSTSATTGPLSSQTTNSMKPVTSDSFATNSTLIPTPKRGGDNGGGIALEWIIGGVAVATVVVCVALAVFYWLWHVSADSDAADDESVVELEPVYSVSFGKDSGQPKIEELDFEKPNETEMVGTCATTLGATAGDQMHYDETFPQQTAGEGMVTSKTHGTATVGSENLDALSDEDFEVELMFSKMPVTAGRIAAGELERGWMQAEVRPMDATAADRLYDSFVARMGHIPADASELVAFSRTVGASLCEALAKQVIGYRALAEGRTETKGRVAADGLSEIVSRLKLSAHSEAQKRNARLLEIAVESHRDKMQFEFEEMSALKLDSDRVLELLLDKADTLARADGYH